MTIQPITPVVYPPPNPEQVVKPRNNPRSPISRFPLFIGLLSFMFTVLVMPNVLLPLITELRFTFNPAPENIYIYDTPYPPLTYFLRLEEKKADVYPVEDLLIADPRSNIHHVPFRGYVPGLKRLAVLNNPLQDLPENIGDLKDLQELHVIGGRLTKLPDSIGELSQLEDLTITENKLKKLPDSIGNLSNLKALNLAYNDLSELPPSVLQLTNLEILDLTGNKFTELPHPIPPRLQWLIIGGNKIPTHLLVNYVITWANDIFY